MYVYITHIHIDVLHTHINKKLQKPGRASPSGRTARPLRHQEKDSGRLLRQSQERQLRGVGDEAEDGVPGFLTLANIPCTCIIVL